MNLKTRVEQLEKKAGVREPRRINLCTSSDCEGPHYQVWGGAEVRRGKPELRDGDIVWNWCGNVCFFKDY